MTQEKRLVALPVQFIQLDQGILLVRGSTEIKIDGPGAAEAVSLILAAVSGQGNLRQDILEVFPAPQRPYVEQLLDHLLTRRIVVEEDSPLLPEGEEPESHQDVFYWNFGLSTQRAAETLNDKLIVVIGVNHLSLAFCQGLAAGQAANYQVVDYNLLRNYRLFDDSGRLKEEAWPAELKKPVGDETWVESLEPERIGCLVALSDFGGQHILRDWNRYCVENRILFLPVVLSRAVGNIGPLVIPGETACYECLRARENANLDDPQTARTSEYEAFAGQAVAGFHPVMASALADMAVFELIKFFTWNLPWRVGELIEVNLLAPELKARKVLAVPRCQVCGELTTKPSQTPLKDAFSLANFLERLDG